MENNLLAWFAPEYICIYVMAICLNQMFGKVEYEITLPRTELCVHEEWPVHASST